MEDNNAGGTVETPTVEQLLTQQLEAEKQARAKAEAKIVEMKTSTPKEAEPVVEEAEPEAQTAFSKEDVEKMIADAVKGKAIADEESRYDANQAASNAMAVGGEEPIINTGFETISIDAYSKMSNAAQREYAKNCTDKTGEVSFT